MSFHGMGHHGWGGPGWASAWGGSLASPFALGAGLVYAPARALASSGGLPAVGIGLRHPKGALRSGEDRPGDEVFTPSR